MVSIRSALIQSLGGLNSKSIPPVDRKRMIRKLQDLYANDPDAGVHSSASWTLRQWGASLPQLPIGDKDLLNAKAGWFVNSQRQTMVRVRLTTESEDSPIGHDFAISSHEVTVAEFEKFRKIEAKERAVIAPSVNCPAFNISWYDAAEYCNWLSKKEGIPEDQWVYEPEDGNSGFRIKDNSSTLSGYRLPTASEWEIACAGGSDYKKQGVPYCFGRPIALLGKYSWHGVNSNGISHPVEALLPNAYGLFDMHGGNWEWTHEAGGTPPQYGGSFNNPPAFVASTHSRKNIIRTYRYYDFGFRVAKTLPNSPE